MSSENIHNMFQCRQILRRPLNASSSLASMHQASSFSTIAHHHHHKITFKSRKHEIYSLERLDRHCLPCKCGTWMISVTPLLFFTQQTHARPTPQRNRKTVLNQRDENFIGLNALCTRRCSFAILRKKHATKNSSRNLLLYQCPSSGDFNIGWMPKESQWSGWFKISGQGKIWDKTTGRQRVTQPIPPIPWPLPRVAGGPTFYPRDPCLCARALWMQSMVCLRAAYDVTGPSVRPSGWARATAQAHRKPVRGRPIVASSPSLTEPASQQASPSPSDLTMYEWMNATSYCIIRNAPQRNATESKSEAKPRALPALRAACRASHDGRRLPRSVGTPQVPISQKRLHHGSLHSLHSFITHRSLLQVSIQLNVRTYVRVLPCAPRSIFIFCVLATKLKPITPLFLSFEFHSSLSHFIQFSLPSLSPSVRWLLTHAFPGLSVLHHLATSPALY